MDEEIQHYTSNNSNNNNNECKTYERTDENFFIKSKSLNDF